MNQTSVKIQLHLFPVFNISNLTIDLKVQDHTFQVSGCLLRHSNFVEDLEFVFDKQLYF